MPPNVKPLDPPPAKRSKGQQAPPEMHITLNIAPTLGVGGEMSYVVLQTPVPPMGSTSTTAPLCPEEVGSSLPLPPGSKLWMKKATYMLVLTLAKCAETDIWLNTQEVLTLMDYEDPQPDGKYIDSLDKLVDFRLKSMKDIYALEELFLAMLGGLDKGGAHKLHQFIKYKILIPLGVHPPPESPKPSIQAELRSQGKMRLRCWRMRLDGQRMRLRRYMMRLRLMRMRMRLRTRTRKRKRLRLRLFHTHPQRCEKKKSCQLATPTN